MLRRLFLYAARAAKKNVRIHENFGFPPAAKLHKSDDGDEQQSVRPQPWIRLAKDERWHFRMTSIIIPPMENVTKFAYSVILECDFRGSSIRLHEVASIGVGDEF